MSFSLTNYIEVDTINQYDAQNYGRNQFDLLDPRVTPTVKGAVAQLGLSLTTHSAYQVLNTRVSPMDRDDEIPRNSIIAFFRTEFVGDDILETENKLFRIVNEARLQNSGINGFFPIVLPSREKTFR